jgi:tetratricopeptide (TPR) repeat protein
MSRSVLVLILLLTAGAIGGFALAVRPAPLAAGPASQPNPQAPASSQFVLATEQQWIVADVVAAIARMTGSGSQSLVDVTSTSETAFTLKSPALDQPVAIVVVDHLWTPATYEPIARQLLARRPAGTAGGDVAQDLNVRAALIDLSVNVLLDQNERVSAILRRNVRSADAHESAALLVGAFALREGVSIFSDVRPALSGMAAHLAIAKALRGGGAESADGMHARAVLTTLAGLHRKALEVVSELETRAASDADRTWARALRLRNTGDWRRVGGGVTDNTRLERLEHARAVRARLGSEALLSYLDTLQDTDAVDWHRVAFLNDFSLEAGSRFAFESLEGELSEARGVWARLHGNTEITREALVTALNDQPVFSQRGVASNTDGSDALEWGMWAAFYQRHVCQGLLEITDYFRSRGDEESEVKAAPELAKQFGGLTLYPVVARWNAQNANDYETAMSRARPMVESAPYLVTASVWNLLLEKPWFTVRTQAFPVQVAWFTPAVPTGTAFDLFARALRPGCPRPPTRAQARTWAIEQPYDHWTVWAEAYLALDQGKPSFAVVRKAFGTLIEYDVDALLKITDYLALSAEERTAVDERLCRLSPDRCDKLASWLLLGDREAEAVAAYERWIAKARDRVVLSNGLTWISRYYFDHGRRERADAITQEAANTGSWGGMQVRGELLERVGREKEAEELYRTIAGRYPNASAPLGAFLLRQALRTGDTALEAKASELLRPVFPEGPQRVVMHALPVDPPDGITFETYGPRPAKTGLRPKDVIIGVDEWRVHNVGQYTLASRFRFDDTMTFTVWREGRYQQVRARVPQRWLGVGFRGYVSTARQ